MPFIGGRYQKFDWNMLGLGLYRAWITLCFIVSPLAVSQAIDSRLVFFAFAVCVSIFVVIAAPRVSAPRFLTVIIVASVLLSVLGACLIGAAAFFRNGLVLVVGLSLAGAGAAFMQIAWGDKLAYASAEKADMYVASAFLLTSAVAVLLPRTSEELEANLLLLILLPIASFVLVLRGLKAGIWDLGGSSGDGRGGEGSCSRVGVGRFAVSVLIFVFVYNFARRGFLVEPATIFGGQSLPMVVNVPLTALLLAFMLRGGGTHRMGLYRLSFTVLIGALVLLLVVPREWASGVTLVADIGYKIFDILFWCVLISIAARDGRRCLRSIALGMMANFAGMVLGLGASLALPHMANGTDATLVVTAVLIFALVVVVVLVMPESIFSQVASFGQRHRRAPGSFAENQEVSLVEICELLSEEAKLTAREGDVLDLLAQGRTQASIAKRLMISENTVHSHITHIYQKFAVHSQQELLDHIERMKNSSSSSGNMPSSHQG